MDFSAPKILIDQAEYEHLKKLEDEVVKPTNELVLALTNTLAIVISAELKKPASGNLGVLLKALMEQGIKVHTENVSNVLYEIHPDQIRFVLTPEKFIGTRTTYKS